jgi:hypothetical protein
MEWCKFFLKPNNHAQVALEAAASASAKNAASNVTTDTPHSDHRSSYICLVSSYNASKSYTVTAE